MSNPIDNAVKFTPTGKFVTKEEHAIVTQLFGLAHMYPGAQSESRIMLNEYLKKLAVKYDHDWTKMSVSPNGELQRIEGLK